MSEQDSLLPDEKVSSVRSVPPKATPFIVLLVAFSIIAGTLVALSIFVGGCESEPTMCFQNALNLPANFSVGNWTAVGNGAQWGQLRVSEERDPPFLLPLLVENDLLGCARLLSVPVSASEQQQQQQQQHVYESYRYGSNGTVGGDANFTLTNSAIWLGGGQVVGQFARIGIQCSCAPANRSILGASLITLSPLTNGTVIGNVFMSDNAASDVVNATDLANVLQLDESTRVRAEPTTYLRTPSKDFLFVNIFTQTTEQGVAVFNSSGIASGNFSTPPLVVTRSGNNTFVPWPIEPTAALLLDDEVYLYIDLPQYSTIARVDGVAALASGKPTLSYYQHISLTNATRADWTSNVSLSAAPDFGCSVRALLGMRALCVSPLETQPSTNLTRNSIQYFELLTPWSRRTDIVPLITSAWGSPFLSVTWHVETLSSSSIWISYVSAIANVTTAMPHTLNVPVFNLLEFKPAN